MGNRTGQRQSTSTTNSSATDTYTQSYNHDNQLTTTEITAGPHSGDSISYTYNANGHTQTKTHTQNGTIQTTEYIYNHSERLIAVTIDGNLVSENSYNPYGQRIKKTSATGTTWYLYNGEGLAAEYSNDGSLIKEYQFTPYSPWMTKPLFQRTASGEVYYYQNDHLGTPQRLIAANGPPSGKRATVPLVKQRSSSTRSKTTCDSRGSTTTKLPDCIKTTLGTMIRVLGGMCRVIRSG